MKSFYKRILRFIGKYSFPIHIIVLNDIIIKKVITFISTLRLKCIFKFLGCSYGNKLSAYGKVIVRAHTKKAIRLGENVHLNSNFMSTIAGISGPVALSCLGKGRIHIGNNSGLTATTISSNSKVTIGNNVKIGVNTKIFDHDFHAVDFKYRRNPESDNLFRKTIPIEIGNDVFIGANSIILKGATIGSRSIIRAGSVISSGDIPSDSIFAGNPAVIIKKIKTIEREPDGK